MFVLWVAVLAHKRLLLTLMWQVSREAVTVKWDLLLPCWIQFPSGLFRLCLFLPQQLRPSPGEIYRDPGNSWKVLLQFWVSEDRVLKGIGHVACHVGKPCNGELLSICTSTYHVFLLWNYRYSASPVSFVNWKAGFVKWNIYIYTYIYIQQLQWACLRGNILCVLLMQFSQPWGICPNSLEVKYLFEQSGRQLGAPC